MTKEPRRDELDRGPELEKLVHEYMRRTGKLMPQTPEEVAHAEAWIAKQNVQLPESLKVQSGCSLTRRPKTTTVLRFPSASSDVTHGLARAAREGKAIAPEVEERMRQDREQKEREADRGE